MSLYAFAQDHITADGGIKTPGYETSPTRVTTVRRVTPHKTQHHRWLENEIKEERL